MPTNNPRGCETYDKNFWVEPDYSSFPSGREIWFYLNSEHKGEFCTPPPKLRTFSIQEARHLAESIIKVVEYWEKQPNKEI